MNNEVETISNAITFYAIMLVILIAAMTFITNWHIDSRFNNLEKMIIPEKSPEQLKIEELEKQVQELSKKLIDYDKASSCTQ